MNNAVNEEMEKQIKVAEMFPVLMKYPSLMKYFDIKSTKMLDKKIEVLESILAGKEIQDIPGFYDIFELLPKEGMWD